MSHYRLGLPVALLEGTKRGKSAIIIGNGKSRGEAPITDIVYGFDDTFGCNILYNDFMPDYLGLISIHILLEVIDNNVWEHTTIIFGTLYPEAMVNGHTYDNSKFYRAGKGPDGIRWSNSGYMLASIAARMGYSSIYLIGIDMDNSNIYRGKHKQYMESTSCRGHKAEFNRLLSDYPNTEWAQVGSTGLECKTVCRSELSARTKNENNLS